MPHLYQFIHKYSYVYILAMAVMNIGMHISFKLMPLFSLDKYTEWNC